MNEGIKARDGAGLGTYRFDIKGDEVRRDNDNVEEDQEHQYIPCHTNPVIVAHYIPEHSLLYHTSVYIQGCQCVHPRMSVKQVTRGSRVKDSRMP